MNKEALAGLLAKDELVLWTGRPASFKIMDRYYKPAFIRNYIIAIVIVGAIIALALTTLPSGSINMNVFIAAVCLPLVIMPMRMLSYNKLKNKFNYVITDRNVLIYASETEILKVPLNSIEKFESVPQDEGTWSVRIGKSFGIQARKNRDQALKLTVLTGEVNNSCLLYNLTEKDAKTAVDLIGKYRIAA